MSFQMPRPTYIFLSLCPLLVQLVLLGLSGQGGQSDIYQDMFNQEVGKLISRAGGIGVADAILREMLKMQELA